MFDVDNPPLQMQIFYPHALRKLTDIKSKNMRFVHYTSADAAVGIISKKQVWMRKSTTMNDFSEIEYGQYCLKHAYESAQGIRFKSLLESIFPGVILEIQNLFNSWLPDFRLETYLTCISEHDDEEDTTGRLSMWRAYGSVALVLNPGIFLSGSDALGAYTSPVAYLDPEGFAKELDFVSDMIEANTTFIANLGRQAVTNCVFSMFRFAVLCTKHLGFKEEREWRVFHSPTFEKSRHIAKSVEVIRGVPQAVFKIPLRDIPEEGLHGASIPALLNRVIIGPTQYPLVQVEAFITLLETAGVHDAAQRVFASDIPLRVNP